MQDVDSLKRLWGHIAPRRRLHLVLLLALMVATSFAEVVSIGAVFPFLTVLTKPDALLAQPWMAGTAAQLGLTTAQDLVLPVTALFIVASVMSGLMRLLLLRVNTRMSFSIGVDLGFNIYHRTLYQPYLVHVSRNTSEIISGITNKTHIVIYNILLPSLNLVSALFILTAVTCLLLVINPWVACMALALFGLIYGGVILGVRRRLTRNGVHIAAMTTEVIKSLQEGLGGIRDILLDGSQEVYSSMYRQSDGVLRRAQADNTFVGQSPRYAVESLSMVVIAVFAYVMSRSSDTATLVVPTLGALAVGAQRVLPVLQQAYLAWSHIRAGQEPLRQALDLLDQPLPEASHRLVPEPVGFQREIRLQGVSFRYPGASTWLFEGLDLTIPKGARVGFVGVTGSGKSTLLDIVMCLLPPAHGQLLVDGKVITAANQRAWQARIAHVPQAIFLADRSIEENIAFGVPPDQIDRQRVRSAARMAQLDRLIESWPGQYATAVGERGVRLSGGQRQRIGIARALYKQADVLVFDEATSALDNETEQAVMESIEGLSRDLTILIIAHRLTTIRGCDLVVDLSAPGGLRTSTDARAAVLDARAALLTAEQR